MARPRKQTIATKTKSRILNSKEWEAKKNSIANAHIDMRLKRHENIHNSMPHIDRDLYRAEAEAYDRFKSLLSIPNTFTNSIVGNTLKPEEFLNTIHKEFAYMYSNINDKERAYNNALNNVVAGNKMAYFNNVVSQNQSLAYSFNSMIGGVVMNPYESQMLFELTSLGYRGVMVKINESFSTTFSITGVDLDFIDLQGIYLYLVEKNFLKSIKTACIDASVYGGGIISPIFKVGKEPFMLADLQGKLSDWFGTKNMKLDSLMTFDRFCVVPEVYNDGMYMSKILSDAPIQLRTIFGDGNGEPLDEDWYSKFSIDAESRTKLIRPDGFGVSVFARAAKAVYNYEQQLQFLNYALSQLSIIVFSSKSQSYENGGSADNTWNSSLGGYQFDDIRTQLSQMQQTMSNERGLYVNDLEVTALNRTFTGIADIINAMNNQAALAFGTKQELLFGDARSTLGNKEDKSVTPMQKEYREAYRSSILRAIKWCVLGYFAEKDWTRSNGKTRDKFTREQFEDMLNSIDIVYNDSIKSGEDIIKESGIDNLLRLVEGRVIPIESAIRYASSIPNLAKTFPSDDKLQEFVDSVQKLQNIGIESALTEQEALINVNKDIRDLKDKMLQEEVKVGEDGVAKKSVGLDSFGEVNANGVVFPASSTRTKTMIEPTQAKRKQFSHD